MFRRTLCLGPLFVLSLVSLAAAAADTFRDETVISLERAAMDRWGNGDPSGFLEIYAPGVKKWLEVSSCSNFEDFQARRAGIRIKKTPGEKHRFVHTLNGSGLALPRIIAGILEYHQTPTGRVRIPAKLVPYMQGKGYLG